MRLMGLDVGTKTIGIALSDEAGITAQPVTTLKRSSIKKDLEELLRLAGDRQVRGFVVGMPVNMDGTEGPRSKSVQKFVELLKEKTGLPVYTWDERFSTIAVTRVLIEGDLSRKRRKEVVDKMAAAYILQGFLDSRAANS
ncbi:MAG: Holliday junction resolvase RuvX [Deltaproteobacteria bacterium]|nr:Holliday junction resolvase RuvX [Deltaproteobacteria bacterium]